MRKQSECNESEYLRAQHQRTLDLEAETVRLKQTISDRDNEINKLKREIHKLKVSLMIEWSIVMCSNIFFPSERSGGLNGSFLCASCAFFFVCRQPVVDVCLSACSISASMMS